MNRFDEEVRIVPNVAWVIAAVLYAGLAACLFYVTGNDEGMRAWPALGRWLFCLGIPVTLAAYVLLAGYINADARRRGMRYVMWTLLACLTPNALGIILYFVLREPLMTSCPQCAARVKQGFAFCPKCGTALAHACPKCRKAVEADWANCSYCGAKLS